MTTGNVVCFPFVGDAVGGSHLSALLLVEQLSVCGYTPLVVVHRPGPLSDVLDRRAIPWEQAPGIDPFAGPGRSPQVVRTLRVAATLARFLRERSVRIVHTNDARIHRTWGHVAHRAHVPQVWHQRNAGLSFKMGHIARMADEVVVVSEFTRRTLPDHLARRARVVDNPFEPSPASDDRRSAGQRLRRELGVPDSTRIVGFVGSFIRRKRADVFVEIARAVLDFGIHDVAFVMLGDDQGPLGDEVRQRIQAHELQGCVHLLGFRHPIDRWMAAVDVLIAPGVDEPFARTLVEAMFVGTPVIASADGGNPEIIEHPRTGILVPANDLDGFAREATSLLASPDRARAIAATALREATARFSAERHATELAQVYDTLRQA